MDGGATLYELGLIFLKFLSYFEKLIKSSKTYPTSKENIRKFYIENKIKSRFLLKLMGKLPDNFFVVNGAHTIQWLSILILLLYKFKPQKIMIYFMEIFSSII